MSFPQRFPRQPWIYDARDLTPMGDPETVIFLPRAASIIGLHIVGLTDGDKMIGIRCDELGRPESCAVTNEARLDCSPVNQLHSNPRRHPEQEIDGA